MVAFSEAKWYLDTPSEIADLSHITCLPKRGNSTPLKYERCFSPSKYLTGLMLFNHVSLSYAPILERSHKCKSDREQCEGETDEA